MSSVKSVDWYSKLTDTEHSPYRQPGAPFFILAFFSSNFSASQALLIVIVEPSGRVA